MRAIGPFRSEILHSYNNLFRLLDAFVDETYSKLCAQNLIECGASHADCVENC